MKSNFKNFDVSNSLERIKEITNSSNINYEEVDEIPSRENLTYTNGFYVNKTGALFVDIRKSSELSGAHKRPRLAKIYRSYISEVVAILNSNDNCREINIVGDAVSGIFNAKYKHQVHSMVSTAAKINSLMRGINYYFRKNGIVEIKAGIGIAYGRSLMIKAGYSGSGINEVVWMGDVVNRASKLCSEANKDTTRPVLIDKDVFNSLENEEERGFFRYSYMMDCYEANIINIVMDEWYDKNCI